MDLKDLTPIVITFVLVGMLLGVGLVILNTFQKSTALETTTTSTNVAWGSIGTNISTITHLKTVTSIANKTGSTLGSGNYTVFASDGERDSTGRIQVVKNETGIGGCTQGGVAAGNCTITYTYYDFDRDAPAAVNKAMDGISELSNNWLLIIMVVVAAGFVIMFIVKGFEDMGR